MRTLIVASLLLVGCAHRNPYAGGPQVKESWLDRDTLMVRVDAPLSMTDFEARNLAMHRIRQIVKPNPSAGRPYWPVAKESVENLDVTFPDRCVTRGGGASVIGSVVIRHNSSTECYPASTQTVRRITWVTVQRPGATVAAR